VAGTCEYGDEPSGSIKCVEFLDCLQPVSCSRRTVLYAASKERLDIVSIGVTICLSSSDQVFIW